MAKNTARTMSLAVGLSELSREIRDRVAAVANEPQVPLEDTPAGRDILEVIDQHQAGWVRQLTLFDALAGAKRYHARVCAYVPEKRGKRNHWMLDTVELATNNFIFGGPAQLRSLCQNIREVRHPKTITVWITGAPTPTGDGFLLFFQHPDGTEALVMTDGQVWAVVGLGAGRINMTLEAILHTGESTVKRWKEAMHALFSTMEGDTREDFEAFVRKCGGRLSEDLHQEFLTLAYLRPTNLMVIQELARSMAGTLVSEAQFLLESNVEKLERIRADREEQTGHMKKTHERAERRFRTDLEKHKGARDVAVKRAQQLERENQALKKQLQGAGNAPAAPTQENTLGLALDRFFA